MDNSAGHVGRATTWRHAWAIGSLVLVVGFVLAVLAGSSAHASPGTLSQTAPTHCTPPTNPYNTSTTVATCGTTTTAPHTTVTLTISYQAGHVKWRACVGASAAGSQVQLYINGNLVDTSTVGPSGCTPTNNLSLCLAQGRYTATAVDQPYGQATQSFNVTKSGCRNPQTLTASAGQTGGGTSGNGSTAASGGGHRGSLAFTGSDIALMAFGAAILIAVGYALLKTSRQGRKAI